MLFVCKYSPRGGATLRDIDDSFLRQSDAGTIRPEAVRNWFRDVSPGSGVWIVEAESPDELRLFVEAHAAVLDWEISTVTSTNYPHRINELKAQNIGTVLESVRSGAGLP